MRDRLRGKTRSAWVVFRPASISRALFQQSRLQARIIVHRPRIRQWAVKGRKVLPASTKASQHVGARDIVASLLDARRDPLQCELWGIDPQVRDLYPVADRSPLRKP